MHQKRKAMGRRRLSRRRSEGRSNWRRLLFESLERRCVLSAAPLVDLSQLEIDTSQFHSSRILVRFQEDAALDAQQAIFDGASIGQAFSLVDGLYEINLADGVRVEDAVAAFQNSASVMYAQPDYRVSLNMPPQPNDPDFNSLWGLHNTGQTGGLVDADIDAPEAWETYPSAGGDPVIVAVIDTGVDYTHPELASRMWVNPGEIADNGIDDDGNGYVDDIYGIDTVNDDSDPLDDHYHGTHVAGTIAAAINNGVGVAGVAGAANVQIMALKFLDAYGSGSISDAVEALEYAVANGAKISNNSWGGGGFDAAMSNAIQNAGTQGHLFIAAAGNYGENTDLSPHYPSTYYHDNVISVAATDHNDELAWFSNYGNETVDLGAPGVNIYSTFPSYWTEAMTYDGFTPNYEAISGTSMATPHVAGVAAYAWSKDPDATYAEIRDAIFAAASLPENQLDDLQGKTVTGGRLNLLGTLDEINTDRGTVLLDKASYGPADHEVVVTVVDASAGLGASLSVQLSVDLTSDIEPLVLNRTSPGIYSGSISIADTPGPNSGLLDLAHGSTITATYTDDDSDGNGTDVTFNALATVDLEPPLITGVNAAPSAKRATITWSTDELADSVVFYGTDSQNLNLSVSETELTTLHSVKLAGLETSTTYYYQVASADAAGSQTIEPIVRSFTTTEVPPILFVDDDNGNANETFFLDAMDANGFAYTVHDVQAQGSPTATILADYSVVVWNTGLSYPADLSLAEQNAIAGYLDGGGSLFLSGQEILYNGVSQSFMSDYLHIALYDEDSFTSVAGVDGDPISNGMSLPLSFPSGYYNVVDSIEPDAQAEGIFQPSGPYNSHHDYAGLRYGESGVGGYKLVFITFPFEAISTSASAPNNQQVVMDQVISWLADNNPPPANEAPIAEAGGSYVGDEGSDIPLDASASTDDGTIVLYAWDFDADGQYDDALGETVNFNTSISGFHTVGLRVTDNFGATATDTAVVTVNNVAPTANAGGPYSVAVDASVTLDASSSSDPGNDIATYEWDFDGDGQYDDATGVNPSYSANLVGEFTIGLKVTDDDGASSTITTTVTVTDAPVATGPNLLTGMTTTDVATAVNGWNTVNLQHSYQNMVLVATPNYGGSNGPGVVRIRNAHGSSFEVQVVIPDGGNIGGVDVYYMVVEAGSYNEAGFKMEAATFTSSTTDRKGAWSGVQQSYANSYINPVVFGQVMTANDTNWSVFWSRGGSQGAPASSSTFYAGKHVGEDNSLPSLSEEIGYIVFEAGSGTVGGLSYEVGLGNDIVQGVTNSAPYSYSHTVSSPTTAIVTQAAMDGGDGSWAVLYGANPIGPGSISVAVDEDQIGDSERGHTTEQLSYIVFEEVSVPNDAPTAVAVGPGNAVDEGSSVSFDGSGSSDPEGGSLGFAWDFGDGATGIGVQPTHTYADDGEYTVTLTVTDDRGATGSDSVVVTVGNVAPTVNAGADQSVNEGDVASFAGSFFDPGSDAYTIQWNFGDGTTANGLSASHAFIGDGIYTVTLTVTDDDGGVGTDQLVVTVGDLDPAASFTFSPTNPTVGQDVFFTDGSFSYDGIASWAWDFGDGGTSDLQNPTHAFSTAGSYNVTLTITESDGDSEFHNETISVSDLPTASPHLVYGQVVSDNESWTTVSLGAYTSHVYEDMVVVATPHYASKAPFQYTPVVVRIRNVTGTSFEFQATDVSSSSYVAGVSVYFVAVEAGVYNQAEHGITMEAATFVSTRTDENNSWVGQQVDYQQDYTSPVVLGQVMSANDFYWSTFWASGSSRTSPPTADTLRIGKMVAEDPNVSRVDETLGYIVFEDDQSGNLDGVDFEVGLGSDIVRGYGNTSTGYAYAHSVPNASAAILTQAGMDGADGSWAVLFGDDAVTTAGIRVLADEDNLRDGERGHTTEQFAYLVLGGTANSSSAVSSISIADSDSATSTPAEVNLAAVWSSDAQLPELQEPSRPEPIVHNVAARPTDPWTRGLSQVVIELEDSSISPLYFKGQVSKFRVDALERLLEEGTVEAVVDSFFEL